MSKSSGRIALYELVNKRRFESAQQKAAPKEDSSEPEKTAEPAVTAKTEWKTKPKTVQLYPDRIELCFSWQVAIIAVLAILAVMLVFFRLGQIKSTSKNNVTEQTKKISTARKVMPQVTKPAVVNRAVSQTTAKMVEPMGDNLIVITSYQQSSHLEPVKKYFAMYGIATEIIKSGSRYLLVTQQRFDNPQKAGTNGYLMKKKIMAVGAGYKPPAGSGYESFGTKPFQDAYGMKIED